MRRDDSRRVGDALPRRGEHLRGADRPASEGRGGDRPDSQGRLDLPGSLPSDRPSHEPPSSGALLRGPLDGLRVLVVDDNADQLYILQTVLNGAGASVQTAHNAQEALDAFEVNPPDVMVSDLSMPLATGYNLIRRIRNLPHGASVPAVAMTAFHADEHWQKALDAGFNEWLPKPAHDLVVRAVARLVGREWA